MSLISTNKPEHLVYQWGDKVVNKTFVSMMEALGYDVRLVYEEREASK